MKVIEVTRTCRGYPAQWEGKLEDGRFFYARYRWSHGRFSVGETLEDAVFGATTPIQWMEDDPFDGELTNKELMKYTEGQVEWPEGFADADKDCYTEDR